MKRTPPREAAGLPHSAESERAVLASVLLQPELVSEAQDSLEPEAFYLERHQEIFRAFRDLYRAETQIDLRTMQAQIEKRGKFELIGGFAYLAGLSLDLPSLDSFGNYVGIVRERWAKRRLHGVGQTLIAGSVNGSSAAQDIAEAEQALADVERGQLEAGDVEHVGDIAAELAIGGFNLPNAGLAGVTSGIADLDKITGGWRPGHLITVAGATGMGKTAAAVGFSLNAAKAGTEVLFISIEMTENELTNRLLSQVSGVPFTAIDQKKVWNDRVGDVLNAARFFQHLPIGICDDPQTPQSIAATCRRHKIKHGLGLVIVDYLHLIEYVGGKHQTHEQLGEMAWSLKMLAKSLMVPILMLHQLSRGVEKRSPPTPRLADLRDSGHVENHSDAVVFAYRPGYYTDDDSGAEAELIIAKNRGGRTGGVKVAWQCETMTFKGLDRRDWSR